MAKRKILFVIESLSGGGAEKVLYTLLKHIDKSKFDVTLCTVVDTGVYNDELKKIVRYSSIIPQPPKKNAPLLKKIHYWIKYQLVYRFLPMSLVYRWFMPKNNDVEIAFVEGFTTKLLSYSNNLYSKKYAWVHTDLKSNHWIKDIYSSVEEEAKSYNAYDQVIGVSDLVSNVVRELYSLKRVKTIYNPIDSDEIRTLAKDPIEIDTNDKVFRLVSVGRFVDQKGFDRLLKIILRLKQTGLSLQLWLLGDGVLKPMYEKFITDNGLEEEIKLLGFKSNPFAYISKCDLFVCSSRSEGYSTAVSEALILGLPVVTTDCSGMKEMLGDGMYGIITKNDDDALYESLRKILTDTEMLNYYRQKSLERGVIFSLSNLMAPIENLLVTV